MNCHDCGKELKGGFGIGERPFSKYRCADCVIRETKNAQYKWCLDRIIERAEKPLLSSGRSYKAQSLELYEKIRSIKSLAKLVVEEK